MRTTSKYKKAPQLRFEGALYPQSCDITSHRDMRTVERLSVQLIDLCRLNHNKKCGSTCQTLAGSQTTPQPAIMSLVNGQNTDVVAFRFSDVFCGQPVKVFRLRQNFEKPEDLYKLTAKYGHSVILCH